jgi:hypothetical protein
MKPGMKPVDQILTDAAGRAAEAREYAVWAKRRAEECRKLTMEAAADAQELCRIRSSGARGQASALIGLYQFWRLAAQPLGPLGVLVALAVAGLRLALGWGYMRFLMWLDGEPT